ncbi:MAG: hypothetical protein WC455_29745 [Dehalococcoidia bacterium]|jgi:hypothetical protein
MNPKLTDALNATLQEDGTLDMKKVIAILEAYGGNVLDAYYTGGANRQDEVREAYATALAWNSAALLENTLNKPNAAQRGLLPFVAVLVGLFATFAPLLIAVSFI